LLASITPLGERGRNSHWSVTSSALIVGATAGGLVLGGLCGLVGHETVHRVTANTNVPTFTLAAAAALACAFDFGVFGLEIPAVRRQVSKEWLTEFRGWVYGLGFGVQLGIAFATIVTSALTYLVFIAAVVSGTPLRGAILGAVFGLGRGLFNLVGFRIKRPDQLLALHDALTQRERLVALETSGAAVVTAAIFLGSALATGGA
jgi:MFS family permease